jgi:hypothetical protein
MEKRSEEKLDKWIRDKQKHTYVRIKEVAEMRFQISGLGKEIM